MKEGALANQPPCNGGLVSGQSTREGSKWLHPEQLRVSVETPQLHGNCVTNF